MSLENNVAIVTGGAGYIGSTTAKRLATDGATVAVCDVNGDLARGVADEIINAGGKAMAFAVDVRNTSSIEAMVARVMEAQGRIDILVNVAGGSARGRWSTVHGSNEEVIREIVEINLMGTIFCCRAVVGHMIEQGRGKIVNISSVVGLQGLAGFADYAAAKAGVVGFSKAFAMEVAPHGINVNCVSPGQVPRPGTSTEHIPGTNYLGKVATADTVSNVIAFLVSDAADFIVGQNYIVDGGRSLGLKGSR